MEFNDLQEKQKIKKNLNERALSSLPFSAVFVNKCKKIEFKYKFVLLFYALFIFVVVVFLLKDFFVCTTLLENT